MRRRQRLLIFAAIGFAIGAFGGLAALASGPATLDALLLPLILVVMSPTLLVSGRMGERWIAVGAAALTMAISLLVVGTRPPVGALMMYAALAAMLIGLCDGLIPCPRRRRGFTRAAILTLAAIGWLLWPIWLAPQLVTWQATVPAWMTKLHPIFAINAVAMERGIWTEMPVPYRLTPLGQDLAYALPDSPWPAVVAHGLIGLAGVGVGFGMRRYSSLKLPAPSGLPTGTSKSINGSP